MTRSSSFFGFAPALLLAALGVSCAGGAGDTYAPGLGEIMSATQMRHLKLGLAADAQNWNLAAYEVDELEEGFADAARFHPEHKSAPRPLTQMIPDFTAGPDGRAARGDRSEERDCLQVRLRRADTRLQWLPRRGRIRVQRRRAPDRESVHESAGSKRRIESPAAWRSCRGGRSW